MIVRQLERLAGYFISCMIDFNPFGIISNFIIVTKFLGSLPILNERLLGSFLFFKSFLLLRSSLTLQSFLILGIILILLNKRKHSIQNIDQLEGLLYPASSLSFWVEVLVAKNSMCNNNCENVLWSPKYFHLNCITLVLPINLGWGVGLFCQVP